MTGWALPGFTELQPLGEGSFGRVVLARQEVTGHTVAIKYLFSRHLADPALLDQFRHEARVLSQISSPQVTRLLEFIETPQGAAIVMEAVPGVPLRALLNTGGALEPEAALAILKGSLLGLAAAHHVGVVHRDYKPDNVLVDPEHGSKLVDFGIAVLAGQSGIAVGTPAYMAPEQWAGQPATPATDVYAATCVFFHCVAGHRPYQANTTEIYRNLHEYAPIPFGEAPEQVRGLIMRGMAKTPAERPADADTFLHELESTAVAAYGDDWEKRGWGRLARRAGALLAVSPLAMIASAAALAPATTGAVAAGSAGAVATGAGGGLLVKVGAIAAGAALVAAGAVVVVTNMGEDPPPAPPAAVQPVAMRVSVDTTTEKAPGSTVDVSAQVVRVSGGDPAVTEKINTALAAPVRQFVQYISDSVGGWGPNNPGPPGVGTEATVGLKTDELLSVRYDHKAINAPHSSWSYQSTAVTIDLRTGDQLYPADFLRQDKLTPAGMEELVRTMWPSGPECDPQSKLVIPPSEFGEHDGLKRLVEMLFTQDGVVFTVQAESLGGSYSCGPETATVPYSRLGSLLRPEMLSRVTAVTSAAPSASTPPSTSAGRPVRLDPFSLSGPASWTIRPQGLEQIVVDTTGCPDPVKYFNCRYFVVTDNAQANAEQPAYEPGKPYRRSANGRACNAAGRKDLWQDGDSIMSDSRSVQVGGLAARFEQWTVQCVPKGTTGGRGEVEITQRIWIVPERNVVILDEWGIEGLDQVLESARWN